MSDKVRIAVIGLGIMGEQYVRIYDAHPLATVTAICTRSQGKLDEVGQKYGITARYSDYRKMFESGGFDAVCVATPDFEHFAPVKAALEAG
ncbi:MAG TPA: Gfo/Idh/MocA family oxidoreductase, partial [Pyrinomonadaceae bacterium]